MEFVWLPWVLFGLVVAAGLAFVIWQIVRVVRMSPEERKETIKNWLVSAVVAAEGAIKEHGAGLQKMQQVLDTYQHKAPVLYKFMALITKNVDIQDLAEKALATVKENFEKDGE